ncbi:hypothetical protein BT63DRAFT_427338 [Microthyrium microscopicum]|uniref:Uncharacterized protein n=1 Tax=Microthyrium microscopicum TaxID=703497 RepID=A0A6A6U5S2_9PEZI|nr:hypothetical protein BT63DRAFT_427338 [Microthyrium microscopicum]
MPSNASGVGVVFLVAAIVWFICDREMERKVGTGMRTIFNQVGRLFQQDTRLNDQHVQRAGRRTQHRKTPRDAPHATSGLDASKSEKEVAQQEELEDSPASNHMHDDQDATPSPEEIRARRLATQEARLAKEAANVRTAKALLAQRKAQKKLSAWEQQSRENLGYRKMDSNAEAWAYN